jgi:gliding motility-associated-like protein
VLRNYYATLADAQAEVSPLPTLYTNTTQYTQTIYVRVENNTNGCYTTSQFNLNVQVPPQFTVTPDFTICAGTSGTISVTPTNFALANATYTWTLNGVALTDTTSTITVTQAGIYEVTVNNSGCTATATTTVTVTALPLVDAPAPVTQCTAYTLPALTNGNYYTGTGGTGTMLTAGTVIPATQTLYIYAQVGTNPVCYSENIFVITITPQITPVFTQLGPFCQFDTAPTLPTTSNNGISGTWNAALSTATAGSTVYTFTPTATLCNGGVTMTVVVNPKPVLPTVAPIERCDGYVLPALPANVSYHTAANGGGTILTAGTNITTSQLIYVYGTSGTTPNCSSETSFNVTITSTPQFTIEAGCDGSEFVLEAIAVNNSYNPSTVTYNWTDSNNTSVGSSSTYSATQTGIYTLTITVPSTSCADSEDYNVTQTACIIQKGISPNGDGSNDSLDLVGFNVKELSIFNRYGAKVYSKTEYTNQWYGQTDKGDELPDGTYYFVIERKDAPTKSGWVYINRVK